MDLEERVLSIPVRSIDGSLLTDNVNIRERWAEHFQAIPNHHSDFDTSVMYELPQWPTASHLDDVPTPEEVQLAVRCRLVRPQAPTESLCHQVWRQGIATTAV